MRYPHPAGAPPQVSGGSALSVFWESVLGIVVLMFLVVVLGPWLWSSRLFLTEKQKQDEERSKKDT